MSHFKCFVVVVQDLLDPQTKFSPCSVSFVLKQRPLKDKIIPVSFSSDYDAWASGMTHFSPKGFPTPSVPGRSRTLSLCFRLSLSSLSLFSSLCITLYQQENTVTANSEPASLPVCKVSHTPFQIRDALFNSTGCWLNYSRVLSS